MKLSSPSSLLLAAAGPAFALVAVSTLWLAAAILGVPHLFDSRTLTLTEATAIASHADVARLLREGADPNAAARLRSGLVRNSERMMTPLEAATGAIRSGPLQMLIDRGATIDERNFPILWCAAAARGNRDLQTFLREHAPQADVPADCSSVRRVW